MKTNNSMNGRNGKNENENKNYFGGAPMTTLGNIIKDYRIDHGMSMEDFSKISGISKGYVSMLENNKNPKSKKAIDPSTDTIGRAASAMNMDFNFVFNEINGSFELCGEGESGECHVPLLRHFPFESNFKKDIIGFIEISASTAKRGEHFAVCVTNNALSPVIEENDIIIIRRQDTVNQGDIAAVGIDDGEPALYCVAACYEDIIVLSPTTQLTELKVFCGNDRERLHVFGRVIEQRRNFE